MSLRVQSVPDVRTDAGKAVAGQQLPRDRRDAALVSEETKSSPESPPREDVSSAEIEVAVDSLNGALQHIKKGLRFTVHEGAERMMVEVVDLSTREVIKEIPPKDLLDTVARIREMIGVLIDERA